MEQATDSRIEGERPIPTTQVFLITLVVFAGVAVTVTLLYGQAFDSARRPVGFEIMGLSVRSIAQGVALGLVAASTSLHFLSASSDRRRVEMLGLPGGRRRAIRRTVFAPERAGATGVQDEVPGEGTVVRPADALSPTERRAAVLFATSYLRLSVLQAANILALYAGLGITFAVLVFTTLGTSVTIWPAIVVLYLMMAMAIGIAVFASRCRKARRYAEIHRAEASGNGFLY